LNTISAALKQTSNADALMAQMTSTTSEGLRPQDAKRLVNDGSRCVYWRRLAGQR
jgi:hypothetical protein